MNRVYIMAWYECMPIVLSVFALWWLFLAQLGSDLSRGEMSVLVRW